MSHFKQLLSVQVEHEFCAPRPFRALQFWPVASTAAAFAGIGCLFRQLDTGFELCHDQQVIAALRLHLQQEQPWIAQFVAVSDDPQFVNYTADLTGGAVTLHFADPVDTQQRLQAVAADSQPLEWQGRAVPRCVVTLHLTSDLLERAPLHYRLPLAARATRWKYYFTGDWPAQPLRIVDSAGLLQFEAVRAEQLSDGSSVQVIVSSAAIALQERPQQRLTLRAPQGGVDRVLIKRLPLASPARLARDSTANAATWLSEIYVAS